MAESSLIPFGTKRLCDNLKHSSSPHLNKLGNKCRAFKFEMLENKSGCLDYIAKNKNVSCMISDAEYQVSSYANRDKSNIKILPEAVEYYIYAWLSHGNSPYNDGYNEVILKIAEFGLIKELFIP